MVFLQAVGADAVAELRFRMLLDVGFHPIPSLLVHPDLVAVHAHGQNALECLDVGKRFLKLLHAVRQRGLQFDELTVRVMRDIVLMGKDTKAYNILQSTIYQGAMYPASIVTPSILVEEMELIGTSAHEPLPVAQNPIFE